MRGEFLKNIWYSAHTQNDELLESVRGAKYLVACMSAQVSLTSYFKLVPSTKPVERRQQTSRKALGSPKTGVHCAL